MFLFLVAPTYTHHWKSIILTVNPAMSLRALYSFSVNSDFIRRVYNAYSLKHLIHYTLIIRIFGAI